MVINNPTAKLSTEQLRSQTRQKMRNKRRGLSDLQQKTNATKLFSQLIQLERVKTAQHIGISLPSDGEIDTVEFIKWCWANNKQVYLPVVHPFSKGHLLFLEYAEHTEMILNRYNILEPKLDQLHACALKKLDIVFTPLVAFDQKGNRIGMGGGYYDRMLAPWFKEKTGPYPIGLAHDCQQIESVPIEAWDVPLPEILTPNQHYRW